MSPAQALFIIRVFLALLLYLFLGGVLLALWRDVRRAVSDSKASDRARARLTIVVSDLPALPIGGSFSLSPITSIGRAPTNTITLPDEAASLQHALISQRGGKWWLEDMGSRNGTTLNGELVKMPTVISAGDVIGLGHVQLKLESE